MLKRLSSLGIVLVLLLTSSLAYAVDDDQTQDEKVISFSDVKEGDWYYDAVMTMAERGVINGYGDNTFRPMQPVLREEFAKMMVLALNLEIKQVPSSFIDVADGYWASPWIETARTYLTGYLRNGEYLFKPDEISAREDMAVALVKGRNLEVTDDMLSVLDDYEDKNLISSNLTQYMAAAVYHKVMVGYVENNKKYLRPNSSLSRAEAAVLILSVVDEDEKVVIDDETMLSEAGSFSLKAEKMTDGYKLLWHYTGEEKINAYRVVASMTNKRPSYPEDGYTDYVDVNTYDLKIGASYVNGDLEGFMANTPYYVAITAESDNGPISSDVLYLKMPNVDLKDLVKPTVTVEETDEGVLLSWDKIDHENFRGYKVVASKTIKSPTYPENGYVTLISDVNTTEYLIKADALYNNGDVQLPFEAGASYFFNITAMYDGGSVSGEGIKATLPIKGQIPLSQENRVPVVTGKIVEGRILLTWSDINTSGLQGYKIVASKYNPNPVYSQDGYAFWMTSLSTKDKYISPYTPYSGGDVGGKLLPGETYYFSVTALYNDAKVAGNAVRLKMPEGN